MSDDWDNGPGSVAFNHRMRQDEAKYKAEDLKKRFATEAKAAQTEKLREQVSRLQALIEECVEHLPVEVQVAVKRKLLAIEVLASDDPLATFGKKLHEAHQRRKK